MDKDKFTVGKKIYLFVGLTVFLAAFGAATISYRINANQIDNYFKNLALHSARNFAQFVDAEYYTALKEAVVSEEYQVLRAEAEAAEDEGMIEEYLKTKGLWEGYVKNREILVQYLHTMEDIKYLYIVNWGDVNATKDMYLMDDTDNPMYETGYYEDRETDLYGVDASKEIPPTISKGNWGWLCSAFVPVYDDDGNLVCQVGCDVAMDDIMKARNTFFTYVLISAVAFTVLVLAGAIYLLKHIVIKPLNSITKEMKKFSPSNTTDYEEAGVINLDIRSKDEIKDIYLEIRSMQLRILDYLHDIVTIRNEKEKVENDIKDREKKLGEMSREAYKDSLTGVGSKAAYVKKFSELDALTGKPGLECAIVMIDANCLKTINDTYGHAAGDMYLKGCCEIICQIYKRSPVFRIGGDEFVVILTGSDYKFRHEKLEELRSAFEKSFKHSGVEPWFRYSVASGMAEYTPADGSLEMVFKRADKVMYDEKLNFKKAHRLSTTREDTPHAL